MPYVPNFKENWLRNKMVLALEDINLQLDQTIPRTE